MSRTNLTRRAGPCGYNNDDATLQYAPYCHVRLHSRLGCRPSKGCPGSPGTPSGTQAPRLRGLVPLERQLHARTSQADRASQLLSPAHPSRPLGSRTLFSLEGLTALRLVTLWPLFLPMAIPRFAMVLIAVSERGRMRGPRAGKSFAARGRLPVGRAPQPGSGGRGAAESTRGPRPPSFLSSSEKAS